MFPERHPPDLGEEHVIGPRTRMPARAAFHSHGCPALPSRSNCDDANDPLTMQVQPRCAPLSNSEQPPETRRALDALGRLKSTQGERPTMRVTTVVHHMLPFIAVAGGALILLIPRLLNYVVAIYLILVGAVGINSIFHFVR